MCPICEQRTGINIKEKGKIKRLDSNKFKRNYSGIKILKLDSKEIKTPNKSEMKNGLNELVRKTSGNISPFQVPLPCGMPARRGVRSIPSATCAYAPPS